MNLANFRYDENGNQYGLKRCKYHCDYSDGKYCHCKEHNGCIYNKSQNEQIKGRRMSDAESMGMLFDDPPDKQDALKEQEAVQSKAISEELKLKMWNALYAEEDKFEKKYVGTKEQNSWFLIYRPWLQEGFNLAIKAIADWEGR